MTGLDKTSVELVLDMGEAVRAAWQGLEAYIAALRAAAK